MISCHPWLLENRKGVRLWLMGLEWHCHLCPGRVPRGAFCPESNSKVLPGRQLKYKVIFQKNLVVVVFTGVLG